MDSFLAEIGLDDAFRAPAPIPTWVEPFLRYYAEHGLLATAAKQARCTVRQVNGLRRDNPDFEFAFQEAHDQAADILEREAKRRAVEGVDEPVYYQGEMVDTKKAYSDTLLKELLKAKRPREFGQRLEIDQTVTVNVGDMIKAAQKRLEAPDPDVIDVTPD